MATIFDDLTLAESQEKPKQAKTVFDAIELEPKAVTPQAIIPPAPQVQRREYSLSTSPDFSAGYKETTPYMTAGTAPYAPEHVPELREEYQGLAEDLKVALLGGKTEDVRAAQMRLMALPFDIGSNIIRRVLNPVGAGNVVSPEANRPSTGSKGLDTVIDFGVAFVPVTRVKAVADLLTKGRKLFTRTGTAAKTAAEVPAAAPQAARAAEQVTPPPAVVAPPPAPVKAAEAVITPTAKPVAPAPAPVPTAPETAKSGKQSWEMTQEEYTKTPLWTVRDTRGFGTPGGGPTGNYAGEITGLTEAEARNMATKANREALEKYNQHNPVIAFPGKQTGTAEGHALVVSDAIALKKPVPDKVLEDYPKLRKTPVAAEAPKPSTVFDDIVPEKPIEPPAVAPSPKPSVGEEGYLMIGPKSSPPVGPVLAEAEKITQAGPPKTGALTKAKELPRKIQTSIISEFTPIRRLEREVLTVAGKPIPRVDLARKFEQVAGARGMAEADVITFRNSVVDPIRDMADDFNTYLFLKRTEQRLTVDPKVKKVGDWTVEKARTGLDELRAKIGDDNMTRLEAAGQAYQIEMDKALRLQVEAGRMTEEVYERIKASNDFYARFKVMKYMEDAETSAAGTGRKIATTQDLTKAITGISEEDLSIGNILQASAEQIVRSRILAEKNKKMLELDKLVDLDKTGKLIKRAQPDRYYPIKVEGKATQIGARRGTKPKPGNEIVNYFKDGKETAIEVSKEVATAIQGLNAAQTGMIAKMLAATKVPLQWGATSANAAFQVRNLLFADLPRAALMSRYGLKDIRDIYRFPADWAYSLFTSVKGNYGKPNNLYMQFLESGAANSTIQRALTPTAFKVTLGIPEAMTAGKAARIPKEMILDNVAKFSNAIEETSKIVGLKRGLSMEKIWAKTPKEAAETMQEIVAEVRNYSGSPDFLRKGRDTQNLNLLFMFFNARVQGITSDVARLAGKTGTAEARAAWARLGTGVALPATILAFYNEFGPYAEYYKKIPQWERDSYFMIPSGKWIVNEDGQEVPDYWRIPKREIVQIIGNFVESAVQFGAKADPQAAVRFANDLIENMSPVNIRGDTAIERLESVVGSTNPLIKAPVELGTERDVFRHYNIIPEYMKGAPTEEQYRLSTPAPYVALGQTEIAKKLGLSPLHIDLLTRSVTAGGISQFTYRKPEIGRSWVSATPIGRKFKSSGRVEEKTAEEAYKKAEEKETTEQLRRRREAERIVREWDDKKTPKQEKTKQIAQLRKTDAKLAEKVRDLETAREKGISYEDRRIATLGVESGARASYIVEILQSLKTPKERNQYLHDLRRKKILTPKVNAQVRRQALNLIQ